MSHGGLLTQSTASFLLVLVTYVSINHVCEWRPRSTRGGRRRVELAAKASQRAHQPAGPLFCLRQVLRAAPAVLELPLQSRLASSLRPRSCPAFPGPAPTTVPASLTLPVSFRTLGPRWPFGVGAPCAPDGGYCRDRTHTVLGPAGVLGPEPRASASSVAPRGCPSHGSRRDP